jgi:type VI secretion system secreted protein VgrG
MSSPTPSGALRARYALRCDALPATATLFDVACIEEIGRPFSLVARIHVDNADVDPATVIGTDLAIEVTRGGRVDRTFAGIVRHVRVLERGAEEVELRAYVVPAWALGDLERDSQIWQGKTGPEILEEVLGALLAAYGREVRLELSGTYPVREVCVRYQETALAFTRRLMEEEGIAARFDVASDVEVLVLTDGNDAFPAAPSLNSFLAFNPNDAEIITEEPALSLEVRRRLPATHVDVLDPDWTKGSGAVVEAGGGAPGPRGRERSRFEHGRGRSAPRTAYDGTMYADDDTARQQELRLAAHDARQSLVEMRTRAIGLRPGSTFEIVGHPVADLDQAYLVLCVEHRSAGAEGRYENRVEAIPLDVPYRPLRTVPKPFIPGIQTALVSGPSGQEIHTDPHGRIKVRFLWDRHGAADDRSSGWIRVQQPWAGRGWGHVWIPRVDMEVVVQFIDGDPDRPLVTGSVYDGDRRPPYALPDHKTRSTIKSNSTPGGGGFNELRFEDRAGDEQIYTHAQRNYDEVVLAQHTTDVGGDQANTVGGKQTQKVDADQTERVGIDQSLEVGGDRSITVGQDYEEDVQGDEARTVDGTSTKTIDGSVDLVIGSDLSESVAADESRRVSGSKTESIDGAATLDVGADRVVQVSAVSTHSVSAAIEMSTPGVLTITSGPFTGICGELTITAPGGFTLQTPSAVNFATSWADYNSTDGDVGGLKSGFTVLKDDFTGVAIGGFGAKFEVTAVDASVTGVDVTVTGLKNIVQGAKLRAGGTKLRIGMSIK